MQFLILPQLQRSEMIIDNISPPNPPAQPEISKKNEWSLRRKEMDYQNNGPELPFGSEYLPAIKNKSGNTYFW